MDRLHGIWTAIVTPFDAEGNLNPSVLPEFLDFQQAAGIDGVIVCGTNGEGPSLSVEERKLLLEAVLERRGGLGVIAGTGAASITDAVDLVRHASAAGADAALVLPPFFFKNPSAQGVAAYYRRVLDAATLPVLLYSIPQQSAVAITDEVISLLAEHPNLAGIKASQPEWARNAELLARWPNLKVFPGADEHLSRALGSGAAGAISGSANAFPDLVVGVRRAFGSQDQEEAQRRLDEAKGILMRFPLIASAKSVLAHRGIPRMWVRPPLVDLTAGQECEMLSLYHGTGLLG